jgi:hypothetical protein
MTNQAPNSMFYSYFSHNDLHFDAPQPPGLSARAYSGLRIRVRWGTTAAIRETQSPQFATDLDWRSLSLTQTFGTFSERDWRTLLTDIYDGQAIPVAGSELSVLPEQAGITLYQQVARQLVCSFKLDESQLPPGYGLLQARFISSKPP